MRTPMERRKAWVSASVLLISKEKISLPEIAVKGVSRPSAWAMPGRETIAWLLHRDNAARIIQEKRFRMRNLHVDRPIIIQDISNSLLISRISPYPWQWLFFLCLAGRQSRQPDQQFCLPLSSPKSPQQLDGQPTVLPCLGIPNREEKKGRKMDKWEIFLFLYFNSHKAYFSHLLSDTWSINLS